MIKGWHMILVYLVGKGWVGVRGNGRPGFMTPPVKFFFLS